MRIATLVGLAAILQSGTSVELGIEPSWNNCMEIEDHRKTEECREFVWGFKADEIKEYKDKVPGELYKVLIHCRDSPDDQDWCWDNAWDIYYEFLSWADHGERAREMEKFILEEWGSYESFLRTKDVIKRVFDVETIAEARAKLPKSRQILREKLNSLD